MSHAYSHGYRPDRSARLAAYFGEALGGPPNYTARYGDERSVVATHSGNGLALAHWSWRGLIAE